MQGRRHLGPPLPSRRLRCFSPRILSIFNERKGCLDAIQGIEKIRVAPLEVFNGCFDFRKSENGKTRSISNRFFHNSPPRCPWPRRSVAGWSSGWNPSQRPAKSVATEPRGCPGIAPGIFAHTPRTAVGFKKPCISSPQSSRGGESRTPDLLVPNQARYQLRYAPIGGPGIGGAAGPESTASTARVTPPCA